MNGKERIAIALRSVANGNTGVEKGTELIVQIFGDVYDEGRAHVLESLNPPTQIQHTPNPKKCYCGACGEGFVVYELGGEG